MSPEAEPMRPPGTEEPGEAFTSLPSHAVVGAHGNSDLSPEGGARAGTGDMTGHGSETEPVG